MERKLVGGISTDFRIIEKAEPPFIWLTDQIRNILHLSSFLGVNPSEEIVDNKMTLILQADDPYFRVDLDRCLEQVVGVIEATKSLQSIKGVVVYDENGKDIGMCRQIVAPEASNF